MTKTLVLVRHAHRSTADRAADNGLTGKGRAQAKALKRFYKKRFGEKSALLLSSPKRRCRETLEPLSESLGRRIKVDDRLLEGSERMKARLGDFWEWWLEEAPRRVVACSHGDWIPAFLALAIHAPIPLKKGGWAEISLSDGVARLECLMQRPR